MKHRLLLAAAVVAFAVPAAASAQSWPDIIGAIAQSQLGGRYDQNSRYGQNSRYDQYGQYGQSGAYGYGRVSQAQAIRIAQKQGVRVQSATRRGNSYELTGRDDNGRRVLLRIDARTGQIVGFDRQWDRNQTRRWDNGDRHSEHDRRDHGRGHDRGDDDDDDDE